MTDAALVAKKLALIETCVADLRRLARPDTLGHDLREERFVQHTLQIAKRLSASRPPSGPRDVPPRWRR